MQTLTIGVYSRVVTMTMNPLLTQFRTFSPSMAAISMAAGVATPERLSQTVRKPYPSFKVIVLNDDENTFEHVVNTLVRYIPGMVSDRAWKLADEIHKSGRAIVWTGPLEQAELYHMQLTHEGLTMAPLEGA